MGKYFLIPLLLWAQLINTGPVRKVFPAGTVGRLDAWPMNEGSGTNFFDLASTNPTTVAQNVGAGSWGAVAGWPATPFTFSGTAAAGTSNASCNYCQTLTVAFSACSWINASSLPGGDHALISTVDSTLFFEGWELGMSGSVINVYLIKDFGGGNYISVSGSTTVSTGVNTQMCFTYDGSKTAAGTLLYVGGSLQTPTVNHNALTTSSGSIRLGLGQRSPTTGSATSFFTGTLGYASVWNCVLTAGVISTNNAAGPSFTGLHC